MMVKPHTLERKLHERPVIDVDDLRGEREEPSNVCDLSPLSVQSEAARGESTFSENLCDFVHFSK